MIRPPDTDQLAGDKACLIACEEPRYTSEVFPNTYSTQRDRFDHFFKNLYCLRAFAPSRATSIMSVLVGPGATVLNVIPSRANSTSLLHPPCNQNRQPALTNRLDRHLRRSKPPDHICAQTFRASRPASYSPDLLINRNDLVVERHVRIKKAGHLVPSCTIDQNFGRT
jgi:hypothetical protein